MERERDLRREPAGSDETRLVRLAVKTAVGLLEAQDGLLLPIAHAIEPDDRPAFIGAYNGGVMPHPLRALESLRDALRRKPYRSVAIIYGIVLPDGSGRNALCIEFESLDTAAATIFVPFVITRPWMRSARVITYAPIHQPGSNRVFRRPDSAAIDGEGAVARSEAGSSERTPPREKE